MAPVLQSPQAWPATTGRLTTENAMNAATQNAAPLFNTVRRSRGREWAVAGGLLIAAYLGVATVLIDNYQRPDAAVAAARV